MHQRFLAPSCKLSTAAQLGQIRYEIAIQLKLKFF